MKKRLAVLSIGVIAVIGAAGCAETKNEAEPAEAAATTATEVPEVDANQEIADTYATIAPKDLASVCQAMPMVGRGRTEKMAENILGSQIIGLGGDVEEVVGYLLDRC